MAVYITSYLLPSTSQAKFLLEDKYLRGGFQVMATAADMHAMHNLNKKKGMLVAVTDEDGKLYRLQSDNSFKEADLETNARMKRHTITLEPGNVVKDTFFDLTIPMGRTVMLLNVVSNLANIQIDCHQTAARNDENPYRFVSKSSRLADTGTSEMDNGDTLHRRRFSFLSNLDNPTTPDAHWRIHNNNAVDVIPVITVDYLIMET